MKSVLKQIQNFITDIRCFPFQYLPVFIIKQTHFMFTDENRWKSHNPNNLKHKFIANHHLSFLLYCNTLTLRYEKIHSGYEIWHYKDAFFCFINKFIDKTFIELKKIELKTIIFYLFLGFPESVLDVKEDEIIQEISKFIHKKFLEGLFQK